MAVDYQKGLMWPVITVALVIAVFWLVEKAYAGAEAMIGIAGFAPGLTLIGAWGGWSLVRTGGGYWHGALAGIVLWLTCIVLDVVFFGVLSGAALGDVWGPFLAESSLLFFGALAGGGWAASER
ncbi:MAG TPA: hypothetical protein VI997_01385 [Candidatus Thermoplasmatota archaeon]|nr:hypothetical protein [Candidatus Thermoplasmatota archaeon]